ncbi:MAG: hypothetical protein A2096_10255 [Spirochaetes bacterium GWF1_41_5]|nr:MAG: hypothetical protein A2096_10255 [Spirochaetes bacterium GWF1_41_5]HBE02313.1 hypothetical protein [Spirochaetia bacterium]
MKKAAGIIILSAVLLGGSGINRNRPGANRAVKWIDHISVSARDPSPLFDFFYTVLDLPVSWPVKNHVYIKTGGIFTGNATLEIVRYPLDVFRGCSGFSGLVFGSYTGLDYSCRILDERKIDHTIIVPFTWFSVTGIKELFRNNWAVTICEFSTNLESHEKKVKQTLAENRGGPLGIRGIDEITVGLENFPVKYGKWTNFLCPVTEQNGIFVFEYGPSLRLLPYSEDKILAVRFKVHSLSLAREFLRSRKMLGHEEKEYVTIGSDLLSGLDLRLGE